MDDQNQGRLAESHVAVPFGTEGAAGLRARGAQQEAIAVTVRYTAADIRAAIGTYQATGPTQRLALGALLATLTVMVVTLGALLGVTQLLVYAAVWFAILAGLRWQLLTARARQILREESFTGEHYFEFTEQGLYARGPHVESRLAWPALVRVVEGDAVFLLFLQSNICQILPKRVLSEEEVGRLRELFRGKVHARKRRNILRQ